MNHISVVTVVLLLVKSKNPFIQLSVNMYDINNRVIVFDNLSEFLFVLDG